MIRSVEVGFFYELDRVAMTFSLLLVRIVPLLAHRYS